MNYGIRTAVPADEGKIRELILEMLRTKYHTDDLLIFDSSIENEYMRLYCAGTLSAEQLDEIRRAGPEEKEI